MMRLLICLLASLLTYLKATIMSTGCQLNTVFALPSDHETPPNLLTHTLTKMMATGDKMKLAVVDND